MPVIPFVIATQPRTGSSLLVSLLKAHEQVTCHGEILKQPAGFPPGGYPELLEHMVFEADTPAAGFKLFFEHDLPGLVDYLNGRGVRLVFLQRDNLLQQYVSWKLAMATDVWMTTTPISPAQTIVVDIDAMLSWFDESVAEVARYRAKFTERAAITVTYEDLVSDQDRELRRVWDLLEVSTSTVTSPLLKQETRSLEQIIENFDQVQRALCHTRWERFLLTGSEKEGALAQSE